MRLDRIVASVRDSHSEVITPARRKIVIPCNGSIDTRLNDPTSKAIMMGRFYEALTAYLYGGRMGDIKKVEDCDGETTIIKPDVIDDTRQHIFECKAVRSGQTSNLLDQQLDAYEKLQEAYPEYNLYLALYRHSLKGIKKDWEGTPRELFAELCQKTAYGVVLPFELVHALLDPQKDSSKFTYRYQNEHSGFDDCVCTRSSTFTRLFTEPEQVISQLGLELGEFEIRKLLTPTSYVHRFKLPSFPIVYISERVDGGNSNQAADGMDDVPF